MKKVIRTPLRIVFYREGNDYVAHCLEFDLVGDGASPREAVNALCEAITIQIQASLKYNNPRNLFTPADGKFFAMFAEGQDAAIGQCEIKLEMVDAAVKIERVEAREYCDSGTACAYA
jgi:hypothetical protein